MDLDLNLYKNTESRTPIAGAMEGMSRGILYGQAINEMRMKQRQESFERLLKTVDMFNSMPEPIKKETYEKTVVPMAKKAAVELPETYSEEYLPLLEAVRELKKNKESGLIDEKQFNWGLKELGLKMMEKGKYREADYLAGMNEEGRGTDKELLNEMKRLQIQQKQRELEGEFQPFQRAGIKEITSELTKAVGKDAESYGKINRLVLLLDDKATPYEKAVQESAAGFLIPRGLEEVGNLSQIEGEKVGANKSLINQAKVLALKIKEGRTLSDQDRAAIKNVMKSYRNIVKERVDIQYERKLKAFRTRYAYQGPDSVLRESITYPIVEQDEGTSEKPSLSNYEE